MRLGGGSKAQVLVTAAWALALSLLILLTASWNLGLAAGTSGVFSAFPEDPTVTYDRALDQLRASKGRALPRLLPTVDRAVGLDPLDGRPLFLHALNRILYSPTKPAPIPMLEASRRQSPRLVETRLLLLDAYGRSGKAGAAMAEAKTLMGLIPQQTPLIVRLMAGLAGRPGGPEELERALPTSQVKGEVMGRLAQTGADSALLERLARPMRGLARDPAQRGWIGQLAYTLLRRPDPDAARTLWSIFYDVSPAQVGAGVTDPEFRQGKGDPPFGWRIAPGAGGIATVRNGGLEVYYYGRSTANFASQMLMLSPGAYWLTSAASSSDSEPASGLAWQVRCMDTTGPLLTTIPVPVFVGAAGGRAAFSVPAENCSSQALLLAGIPPDVPRNQSARIERVAIERKAP
jgi:hypothetical protein